jgi:hypothetical protein
MKPATEPRFQFTVSNATLSMLLAIASILCGVGVAWQWSIERAVHETKHAEEHRALMEAMNGTKEKEGLPAQIEKLRQQNTAIIEQQKTMWQAMQDAKGAKP